MKNRGFVTAYKGAITQQFTRTSWEVMGTDKCGWVLVPEVPKEVVEFNKKISDHLEMAAEVLEQRTNVEPSNVQPLPQPTPAKTRKSKKRK